MIRLFIVLVLFSVPIYGQLPLRVYDYVYDGLPGDVISYSIPVVKGQTYLLEYCTNIIPDELIVYTNDDSLKFSIGQYLVNDPTKNQYHGYAEFRYSTGKLTEIVSDTLYLPPNIQCEFKYNSAGIMRLYYTSDDDDCSLDFVVRGNQYAYTVYDIIIDQITMTNQVDSMHVPVCTHISPHYKTDNCTQMYVVPSDSSIIADPILKNAECERGGSINFPGYEQFNLYNVLSGKYQITVSNSICSKIFDVVILQNACNVYIPNVFSPNEDGQNDQFIVYSDKSINYQIRIYDRWGNLLYAGNHITNNTGWDGVSNSGVMCSNDVYVYTIKIVDQSYSGSITILK